MTDSVIVDQCGRAAKGMGTPLYLFDLDSIESKLQQSRLVWEARFPLVKIAYSYKTNSLKAVTEIMRNNNCHAEVVSGAELHLAIEDGFMGGNIVFNGPMKSPADIALAIRTGSLINADSLDDLRLILSMRDLINEENPLIGLRLASNHGCSPSRFGMTVLEYEEARNVLRENQLPLAAIHFHVGSNLEGTELHRMVFRQYRQKILQALEENQQMVVDIGGGFPAATVKGRGRQIATDSFADEVAEVFDEIGVDRMRLKLIIEPGRCLVEDAGHLVTSVRARKERENATLLIVDAGLNLVKSMHTWSHDIQFGRGSEGAVKQFSICGCNCYESDILASNVTGPADIGTDDLIIVGGAGGYDFATSGTWTQPSPAVAGYSFAGGLKLIRVRQLPSQIRERHLSSLTRILAMDLLVDGEIELRSVADGIETPLARLVEKSRSYLSQWLPWVRYSMSISDSAEFVSSEEQARQLGNRVTYGIWMHGQLTGMIAFHQIDWANQQAAIGYWLAESQQGNGIVTRSCQRLVEYGFVELGLCKMVIRCAAENWRSRAVPERLGFSLEGMSPKNERVNDQFLDQAIYSMSRSDWRDGKMMGVSAVSG